LDESPVGNRAQSSAHSIGTLPVTIFLTPFSRAHLRRATPAARAALRGLARTPGRWAWAARRIGAGGQGCRGLAVAGRQLRPRPSGRQPQRAVCLHS